MVETTEENEENNAIVRGSNGRFVPGTCGYKGHISKRRMIYKRIMEEAGPLLEQAFEMAKAGDDKMVMFLLSRILPSKGILEVSAPNLELSEDSGANLRVIMESYQRDELTSSQLHDLMEVVQKQVEIQSSDLYQLNEKFNELQKRLENKHDD